MENQLTSRLSRFHILYENDARENQIAKYERMNKPKRKLFILYMEIMQEKKKWLNSEKEQANRQTRFHIIYENDA